MATKFTSLDGAKREQKKTVFTHSVNCELEIAETNGQPQDYKNVLHLWTDKTYGDVFKAWDDDPNDAVLLFGIKGDEFD